MKLATLILSGLLSLASAQVNGQQQTEPENEKVDMTPLTMLGDDYQNSIKLLQNRFRIDYEVDEITMIFFRRYGSAPVVLVKPDGSKIFQSQSLDSRDVEWFDSSTFDMVKIKQPTPGPWQAMGQILPESRLMVVSDISLHAEPLPHILFSGEILKLTATLSNEGEQINEPTFRDVVDLTVTFVSTNDPNQNNFGAKTEVIASFEDNGRGMDERPMDGIFTGQFNLNVPDGEWRPVFEVSTPMYSRQQTGEPIRLKPNPVQIVVNQDTSAEGKGYHQILIDADREFVDINTLLIDGKVRFPNGDVQTFSMTEVTEEVREHKVVNYEYGIYRIKVTACGTTKDGRDFILDVPEVTFLAEEPKPELPEATMEEDPMMDLKASVGDQMSEPEEGSEPEMATSTLVGIVIGLNVILLLAGGGLLWWVNRPKVAKKEQTDKTEKKEAETDSAEQPKSESDDSEEGDEGVVELSMPD